MGGRTGRDPAGAARIRRSHVARRRLLAALALLAACAASTHAGAAKSPYDWASIRLDYLRDEKTAHLERLLTRLRERAAAAADDELTQAFFTVNREYWAATTQGAVPKELRENVAAMREHFTSHYAERYFTFYDMLFVDRSGKVFYSIRKESDLHGDLGQEGADLPLARCIASKPGKETFVDFHYYHPSSEPAAFFVEPVERDGRLAGWLVLQCAINKINSLFTATGEIGQTGETFLVNADGYMLTESQFRGGSTILTQRLDDRNIHAKFRDEAGRRTVTDYRGATALTSFEVVEFMGARWLVVAKIDKDEVTTRHYARHARYFSEQAISLLAGQKPKTSPAPGLDGEEALRVDMDEFLRAGEDVVAETYGVATCCAVLAAYPGRFAYLAHVSPKDKLYGGSETDLLGQITQRLETFDIYPSERRQVLFLFAAPQLEAFPAFASDLIGEGYFVSQIRIAHDSRARSAAIRYRSGDGALEVEWRYEDGRVATMGLEDTASLREIVELIMASH